MSLTRPWILMKIIHQNSFSRSQDRKYWWSRRSDTITFRPKQNGCRNENDIFKYIHLTADHITSRPKWNGHHTVDTTFKYIYLIEIHCVLFKILPKFVPKWSINNRSALLQVMIWHQPGTKSLLSHYSDVIMGATASRITSPTAVYSTVYSGADQRKH